MLTKVIHATASIFFILTAILTVFIFHWLYEDQELIIYEFNRLTNTLELTLAVFIFIIAIGNFLISIVDLFKEEY